MTTRDIGIVLHEELDRREKLIEQLNKECDGLRTAIGILERPTPEQHNRVTRVVGRRGRKSAVKGAKTANGFRCDKCGADDFTRAQSLGVHRKSCDGIRRTREERKQVSVERFIAKKKKAKTNGNARGAAADNGGSFSRIAQAGNGATVPCDRCGEKFPDAKAMGIHKTRAHFGVDA